MTGPEVYDKVLQTVLALLTTVVVPVVVQYFSAKRDEAKANAQRAGLSKKQLLMEQVKEFLLGQAANFAEKKIPEIAAAVVSGKLETRSDVKANLYALGIQLKDDAVAHFGQQGFDLAKEVGEETLMSMIENAANKVSPFPGLETGKILMKKQVADLLVRRGSDWMRTNAHRVVAALEKPVAPAK